MDYGHVDTSAQDIDGSVAKSEMLQVLVHAKAQNPTNHLRRTTKGGGRIIMSVSEVANMSTMAVVASPTGSVIGPVRTEPPFRS